MPDVVIVSTARTSIGKTCRISRPESLLVRIRHRGSKAACHELKRMKAIVIS